MNCYNKPAGFCLLFFAITAFFIPSCKNTGTDTGDENVIKSEPVNDSLQLRNLTGVLSVSPVETSGSRTDYWIYVNGTLIEKNTAVSGAGSLKPVDITLLPGEYNLEVLNRSFGYPFHRTKKTAMVKAGETTNVTMDISYYNGGAVSLRFSTLDGGTWEEWLNDLRKNVKVAQDSISYAAIVTTLNETRYALASSPPQSKAVFINLPEEYGGGREYDSEQVRKIIEWIKTEYVHWFPIKTNYPQMPTEVIAQFDQLDAVMTNLKKYVEGLNSIADKLDKVTEN